MDRPAVLKAFESLSSGVRLDVFRLLVEAGAGGLVAGQIAQAIGIPATNLSFHMKALRKAGLVTVQTEGRFQRYRANVPQMLRVMAYVTESCFAPAERRPGATSVGERLPRRVDAPS